MYAQKKFKQKNYKMTEMLTRRWQEQNKCSILESNANILTTYAFNDLKIWSKPNGPKMKRTPVYLENIFKTK